MAQEIIIRLLVLTLAGIAMEAPMHFMGQVQDSRMKPATRILSLVLKPDILMFPVRIMHFLEPVPEKILREILIPLQAHLH